MMYFLSKILGRRLVQTSAAEFNDGWGVIPITFLLFEDRWGRRSYRVEAPPGVVGAQQHRFFDGPIQAWLHGGQRPPTQLGDARFAGRGKRRSAASVSPDDCACDALSMPDRERLSKFLAMLNSEHDGEVVNAAKAASAFLKSRNLTWADALGIGTE